MTTLDEAPLTAAPLTPAPGWLRHAWTRHLADADPPSPARHEYMVTSALPDLLEPFLTTSEPDADGGPSPLLVRFDGVDAATAAALLGALPDVALQRSYSTHAPSPRKLLAAVAKHGGLLTCGGELTSPALVTGGMRLWRLTVNDPSLLDAEPDLVAGTLPPWLDSLAPDAQLAYLHGRQECLDHGLRRQAWIRVATRFGIGGARRLPVTEVLADELGAPAGVRFQW